MIRSTIVGLASITAAVFVSGCAEDQPEHIRFEAMGTTGSIQTRSKAVPPDTAKIPTRLDAIFSHWRDDTPLSQFNRAPAGTPFEAPAELIDIVLLADSLRSRTGGDFDITAGSTPGRIIADHQKGTLMRPHVDTRIDLSAVAKGYAIDRIAEALEAGGVDDYLIEFGGELRAGPGGSWSVGIELPDGSGALLRQIELRGESIATSGTYRLGDHILDPAGHPATRGIVSASVLALTAAEADALATAAVVSGKAEGESLLVFDDGRQVGRGRLGR